MAKKPSTTLAETKAAKFKRLAEARTTKAINAIRAIKRLTGSNYEYTPAQATKIAETLKGEVVGLHEAFTSKSEPAKEGFTL